MTGASRLLEAIRESAPDHNAVIAAMRALLKARGDTARRGPDAANYALRALGFSLARIGAAANLVARASMWLDRKGPRPDRFTYAASDYEVPSVLNPKALSRILDSEPRLAQSAEEVRKIYSRDYAFALAKSCDIELTRRVQKMFGSGVLSGISGYKMADVIMAMGDWTRAYAQTVVRTNVSTAYASGRFREAERMADLGLISGLRFSATHDGDVRPNHLAADGLIASVDDPVWQTLSPPLGYNCRCTVSPVDKIDVPRDLLVGGRIRRAASPPGARADYPEFGRRPVGPSALPPILMPAFVP